MAHFYVVHRIDLDCSGITLFAKNADSHRELSLQFEKREVYREYLAVVEGKVEKREGIIDLPIHQRKSGPNRSVIRADGKPSQTSYEAVRELRGFSLPRSAHGDLLHTLEGVEEVAPVLFLLCAVEWEGRRATVRGLGLRKLHQVVERQDTPMVRGMIRKIPHLVAVVE